jgi:hypothetical protein
MLHCGSSCCKVLPYVLCVLFLSSSIYHESFSFLAGYLERPFDLDLFNYGITNLLNNVIALLVWLTYPKTRFSVLSGLHAGKEPVLDFVHAITVTL